MLVNVVLEGDGGIHSSKNAKVLTPDGQEIEFCKLLLMLDCEEGRIASAFIKVPVGAADVRSVDGHLWTTINGNDYRLIEETFGMEQGAHDANGSTGDGGAA